MKANQYIARTISVFDSLDKKGNHIPLLLMSHPGFGKTSTIRKYCELSDYNLVSLIVTQYNSDDVLGLQSLKDGHLVRLTPSWFDRMLDLMKNGKRTLLLLDEITTANEYLQGPLLDLIFSRSLGEVKLPDNLFIVAAGNYSDDLNSTFRISAPLVNRFMILNLRNEDFDVGEYLDEDFENLKLDLGVRKSAYSFDLFRDWIKTQNEIQFGKSQYSEDEVNGLLGFTSIRSLTYSLKFAEEYLSMYDDDLWMRIVGDTLGYSEKRKGKTLSAVLNASKERFIVASEKAITLTDLCKIGDIKAVEEAVTKMSRGDFTQEDISSLQTLINQRNTYELKDLMSILTSKGL